MILRGTPAVFGVWRAYAEDGQELSAGLRNGSMIRRVVLILLDHEINLPAQWPLRISSKRFCESSQYVIVYLFVQSS